MLQRRHNGRFNVLFCDMHIESMRWETISSREEANLARWNNDHLPHASILPNF
jgi:prepilin-type processing-associated H-X9-DG protein